MVKNGNFFRGFEDIFDFVGKRWIRYRGEIERDLVTAMVFSCDGIGVGNGGFVLGYSLSQKISFSAPAFHDVGFEDGGAGARP